MLPIPMGNIPPRNPVRGFPPKDRVGGSAYHTRVTEEFPDLKQNRKFRGARNNTNHHIPTNHPNNPPTPIISTHRERKPQKKLKKCAFLPSILDFFWTPPPTRVD